MNTNIQKLKRNFEFIRNFLLIRPTIFSKPKLENVCLSDFFFYDCRREKDTKVTVFNIFSQVNPDSSKIDFVNLYIIDYEGNIFKKIKFSLKPNENNEITFSDHDISNYGSFFIFHSTHDYHDLNLNGSYPSERGYVGYKENDGIWNFVHGNRTCNYLLNGEVKSIVGYSFFESTYIPQVDFSDTKTFMLIFNNPLSFEIKIKIDCFSQTNKKLSRKIETVKPLATRIASFDNVSVNYVKIHSRVIFCRPIIYKKYHNYFDIFHG